MALSPSLAEILAFEKSGVQIGGTAQWFIHDILDVPCRAQGCFPESFKALSSFLPEI